MSSLSRLAAAMVLGLLTGCAGPAGSPAPPSSSPGPAGSLPATVAPQVPTTTSSPPAGTPSPSAQGDASGFGAAARAFVDRFNSNWADAAAAFAGFTTDSVIIDPSNADFTIGPGPEMTQAWAAFARDFPEYRATTTGAYVSDDVGAYPTEVSGLPVNTPDGLLRELRVFRFTDGTASAATAMELWYEVKGKLADPANTRLDCVAPDRCVDDARAFAETYLAAWTSRDPGRIAALYRRDATLTDGALGISATGTEEIGKLAGERFRGAAPTCEVRDVYVQTDDGDPRTSDNTDPKGGTVAGIAIVHRCAPGTDADAHASDGVTLLIFGTRQPHAFDNDPDGLIVSDETLHDAASLAGAGLAP